MKIARWQNTELARSDQCIMVEGNAYFPPDAVHREFLLPSDTHSHCSWKGQAHYHHIKVGEALNKDAAWFYPEPYPDAAKIRDYIAFWKGVEVTEN